MQKSNEPRKITVVTERHKESKSTQTVLDEEGLCTRFAGYTTVHGLGRIADATYVVQKALWIVAFLGCCSFCFLEIFRLIDYYASNPVNTKVTTEYGRLPFPGVSICNINPGVYSIVKTHSALYDVINQTANAMDIDLQSFENGLFQFNQSQQSRNATLEKVVLETKHRFFLRLGSLDDNTLKAVSQTFEDFFIQCKFGGITCNKSDFQEIRDENYGSCFTFKPPVSFSEISGLQLVLELILNVNQKEYVPFVTDAAGVRIKVHDPTRRAFFVDGYTLPTGFEVDVALTLTENRRYAGLFSKCDTSNIYGEVQECIHDCIGFYIARLCHCASEFWFVDPDIAPFLCDSTEDIDCITSTTVLADCSSCKVPCTEINFKPTLSYSTWPSKNYEPLLQSLVQANQMNYTDVSNDLLLIRVYYSSLTKEITEEEGAYPIDNLVSDLGGQLGLWGGMSMLSVFEVIELFTLLIQKYVKNRKKKKTQKDTPSIQREGETKV